MPEAERTYIPAAGYDWLLFLYDPLIRLMGGEAAHRTLIDQADLRPGHRVLEIGCGTGNMTTLVKRLHPSVDVVGLDPDPKALERARRKADRQGAALRLDRGFSDALPYPVASYDRVLSAFMFHHLERDQKAQSLHEIRRVLRPGGALHLLDFGGPQGNPEGFLAGLLHRGEHGRGNAPETILALMRHAGLENPAEMAHQRTIFGRIFYYRAFQPLRSATADP
jgi:ubiquinone/menaquinone biosynthesis C-methylase UbiE